MPLASKLCLLGIGAAVLAMILYDPPVLAAMFFLLAAISAVARLLFFVRALPSLIEQLGERRRGVRRLRQLPAARVDESICQFARSFEVRRTDTWVLRAVYEALQDELRWVSPAFPVHADDSIKNDLLIDGEDLDLSIVWCIAERARRRLEHPERNPFSSRVVTVRDLVSFFVHQPRIEASG
jgi:hypothetical protein